MSFDLLAARGLANSLSDPRSLPRFVSAGTSTTEGISFDGWFAAQSQFWTAYGSFGVAVDSNNAADTYKDLVNISSGRGALYRVSCPAVANNGDVVTLRFTVDGRPSVTIAETIATAGDRLHIGHAVDAALFTTAAVVRQNPEAGAGVLNAAKTAFVVGSPTTMGFMGLHYVMAMGAPVLRFSSSLRVELKLSAAQNGTANKERQAGVAYVLET